MVLASEEEKKRREAFYRDIDDDMKAEFINGEIIIHGPEKKEHLDAIGCLYHLLDTFVSLHELGYVGYIKVMTALTRNDYEPDVVFFKQEKAAQFKKGHWKYPAPDLVVEVLSTGTEHRDRGIKSQDYAAHKVEEYWIIDPIEETIEQYFLEGEEYKLHLKLEEGMIRSKAAQGFVIPVRAVFDRKVNLEALKGML